MSICVNAHLLCFLPESLFFHWQRIIYRIGSPVPKKKESLAKPPHIALRGCHQHNLQGIDLDIPLGKLTVVTGPSGSGKSSLAFHTLYAEGQRRYVETFSPYVRQFFDRMDKPLVDSIEGIPPAIAIEQKNHVRTTRSTVGTLTEINDYLKLLFPRLASGFDPHTNDPIAPDSPETVVKWVNDTLSGKDILITFPIPVPPKADPGELFPFLNSQGYLRVLIKGKSLRTDELPPTKLPPVLQVVQDRIKVSAENHTRLFEALEAAFALGKGHLSVYHSDLSQTFTTTWTNPRTGFTLRAPSPALFSFNSPLGACAKCRGFGRMIGIDPEKAIPDPSLSLRGGAIKPFQGDRGEECQRDLVRNCKERGIDLDTPYEDFDEDTREWIYYGDRDTSTPEELEDLWQSGGWYGVKGFFDWIETKAYKMHVRVFLSRYRSYTTCDSCRGKRLQAEALCFKISGKTLPDLWQMPIAELLPFVRSLISENAAKLNSDTTLKLVLTEIQSRLYYLDEVGLSYLTLDRPTRTLSGGEIERVNLTTCLGASLTGTLFVLDEPTVGLHPRDIDRLVGIMHGLRDKGNTLVVVEHEQTVMEAADNLIDIGPGAGQHGGTVIFHGDINDPNQKPPPAKSKETLGTLPWLTGAKSISVPVKLRKPKKAKLKISGASKHNIKNLSIEIPLGLFSCLTGVSGSGKSTLAHQIIYLNTARKLGIETNEEPAPIKTIAGLQHLAGIELIDQTAVARTPRSTPAVFLGAFDPIRQLFTDIPDAKARDLKAGFFSFNSGEGRCDRCAGNGFEKVEMQFLSDIYVTCPDCEGKRYKPSTLEFFYRGKSIHDVLDSTVTQAIEFYDIHKGLSASQKKRHQTIVRILTPLVQVGLGYLKLGQALNTLSGGESQRLKLCQLLASTPSENSGMKTSKLLILDEPTTGLHFSDIENLLAVFQKLVDNGHTLLVIEHNLDVIKSADWLLEIGPEAGRDGGELVAQGSPEEIAKLKTSTAAYLREALGGTQAAVHHRAPASTLKGENPMLGTSSITLRGARHHNLKNISVDIPRDELVVISGLSGSGKSTLAFDILFAEGQRRFLDSMSAYARQFAEQLEKPEIDQLQGLPPTVAIEQRISQGGSKSTVATVTELWNFIRLLYAKLGTIYCPECDVPVEKQSVAAIEKKIRAALRKGPVKILAPLIRGKKGYHTEVATWASKQGFTELLVDKQFKEAERFTRLERFVEHDIDVVVADSALITDPSALGTQVSRALAMGKGLIKLFTAEKKFILLSTNSSCPSCNRSFEELDPRLFSFNSPHGWCKECKGHGKVPKRRQRQQDASRFDSILEAELDAERSIDHLDASELTECTSCYGSRINPIGAAVRLGSRSATSPKKAKTAPQEDLPRNYPPSSIAHLTTLSIDQASEHFEKQKFKSPREELIARDILPEIAQRLDFLKEVGLGYLHLNRSGNTLVGR